MARLLTVTMFKSVMVAAVVAVVSSESPLRFNPLVLGSTQLGKTRVIVLSPLEETHLKPVEHIPSRITSSGSSPPSYTVNPFDSTSKANWSTVSRLSTGVPSTSVNSWSKTASRLSSSAVIAEKPQLYAYKWHSEDEFGTKQSRQESSDSSGRVTGSYSFTDSNGLTRLVTYFADHTGFHANVNTNEPGTRTSNPADVMINSSAQ